MKVKEVVYSDYLNGDSTAVLPKLYQFEQNIGKAVAKMKGVGVVRVSVHITTNSACKLMATIDGDL